MTNEKRRAVDRERVMSSCALVVFGAAGNLARNKLFPAVHRLMEHGLVEVRTIIGVDLDTSRAPCEIGSEFLIQGDVGEPAIYRRIRERLERGPKVQNVIYYFATPPGCFGKICEGIAELGRLSFGPKIQLIVEKPFGVDLAHAQELDHFITTHFKPEEIFRVDHFLAKNAVQNLLAFRFGNRIFDAVCNRDHVDHVQITMSEPGGVTGREDFYEQTGVVRDVLQNHLLQVLSFVVMEPPPSFDPTAMQKEMRKVVTALRPQIDPDGKPRVVFGQYGPGTLGGEPMSGYREEPGVPKDSVTDTFIAMKVTADLPQWAGVPFYLRTGKRMAEKQSDIIIQFKESRHAHFSNRRWQNRLCFSLLPGSKISLRLAVRDPSYDFHIKPFDIEARNFAEEGPELSDTAYEQLLVQALKGDQLFFMGAETLLSAWEFTMPLLEPSLDEQRRSYPNYPAGSWGPRQADELIARDGRQWLTPGTPLRK